MASTKFHFPRYLLNWYDIHRRDLPWRVQPPHRPNPYHVLVSETMLQQTQVRTVLPYFHSFIQRWPTLKDLAEAEEQEVLRLWQGLGYYSRARNLLRAARAIVDQHRSRIPGDVASLMALPGIGRYTAGAVASIAYDTRAPIVDGNVARVLCRIDQIRTDPRAGETQRLLWRRAEQILPKERAGDFNSAMMELGSTICTPRSPQCPKCPVRRYCRAFASGSQERIPAPRKARLTPMCLRRTFCLRRQSRSQTTWLIEQRSPRGRWAGMWQFVTVESDGQPISAAKVRAATGVRTAPPRLIGAIDHALTHRRYRFEVHLCDVRGRQAGPGSSGPRRWVTLKELDRHPLPRPHVRIAELLHAL